METNEAGRAQSSIQFPYSDLGDALAVAKAMMAHGGVPLSRDQLAAAMNQAPSSGNFGNKVGTARTFGVIKTVGRTYELTELGFEIVDEQRQQAAMARAFLNVELYKKVYDEFRGKLLPPRPFGLEAAFVSFGVAPKQKDKARQAFDRSARMAGFFPNGNEDRLVMPIAIMPAPNVRADSDTVETTETPDQVPSAPIQAPSGPAGLHQSIIGMLGELPPPKSEWSKEDQANWLQALAGMFRVIYKSDGGAELVVQVSRPHLTGKMEGQQF